MWAVVWCEGVSFVGCGKFFWSGGKRVYHWWMVAWRSMAVQNSTVEKWRYADVVQEDIWAKRGAGGDIYELDPLQKEEEPRRRSAIGRLVDELAHQTRA